MEPIAIIGMAARFPGSADVGEYWSNLRAGRELVTFLAAEELLAAGLPPAIVDDPNFVRASARVPGHDEFDAEFFGITPREARLTDPQMRAFMEVSHSAMEDAGYDPYSVPGAVGVYGGLGYPTYGYENLRAERIPANEGMIALLNGADYLATHVSYKFGYTGPSMTILTACSSSLTAVHLACQALQVGDCDLALAGGVNIDPGLMHGYWFVPGGVRSRDGHCRPFDASAGGTVFGQGAGVVVLKRLVDANADGDCVRAVVLGTGLNNDGSDKVGFGAPSVSGQVGCIQDAMLSAQVQPEEIGYVEAHGTGTALGDPIEVTALAQAWRVLQDSELEPGSCLIGSVKSNIGHSVQAAGVAGLIKLALALEQGEIPATVNFSAPNPKLELEKTPFVIADRLSPWPAVRAGGRRIGALSSLGAGGTNAHAVVAAPPAAQPTPARGNPRLVVFSARSETAADQLGQRLAGHFKSAADTFEDSVTTLQRGRRHYEVRRAAIAADWQEAASALGSTEPPSGAAQSALIAGRAGQAAPAVAFTFPGQGSLFPRMGLELYSCDSAFRAAADECLALYGDRGHEIRERWASDSDAADLADTAIAQPLLFLVEYALARSWQAAAGPPSFVLGHSLGELVAATMAGVFDLATAAHLVLRRADAMAAMPPGAMAALFCQADAVAGRLPEQVSLAAVNSAAETVVAGPREAVEALLAELRADGIRSRMLRTSHGFHSPAMAPAAEAFEREVATAALAVPALPMISAATGRLVGAQEAVDPHFWAAQLVTPVWYARALDCLIDSGARLVIEMGPGEALTALARGRAQFDGSARTATPVLPRPRKNGADQERRAVLHALGTAWTCGLRVNWTAVDQDCPAARRPVPGYPYQRQRYWIDVDHAGGAGKYRAEADQQAALPAPGSAAAGSIADVAETAVQDGQAGEVAATASPFSTLTWLERPRPQAGRQRGDLPAVVLLPPQEDLALRVTLTLQQAGLRVYPVRMDGDLTADAGEAHARPGRPEDLRAVFSKLAERGVTASCLVHATALPDWDQVTTVAAGGQLDLAYFSLLALVQQAAMASAGGPASVLVLASRSVDVAGGEPVDPVKATLHGQLRTMLLEQPQMRGLLIDVGRGVPEEDLVDEVRSFAAALAAGGPAGEPVVALRGGRRWVRREMTLTLASQPAPPIRRKGTYLITGGLGGLGLAVAGGLARTGLQPSLILVGRAGLPEGDELAASLAAGDARTRRVHDAIREITRQGCAVRVIAADVADARAMRRALDIASAHLGPLNGVLHLAGVAGDGMQLLRSPERAAQVLRPKVVGTLQLQELLAERGPLDFFVTFSSRASLNGLVGSGDYAAANAFADALSGAGGLVPGSRQLSINWPAWARVGMAAAADMPQRPPGTGLIWETALDASSTWALDEHRLDGVPVLPGTAHLDLVVRAFRDLVSASARVIRIEEAVFHRALAVPANCTLRVTLRRDGQRWRFRTESLGDDGPLTHASGRIEELAADPRTVDLQALRARFAGAESLGTRPETGRTFRLGPRWDALIEVLQRGQEKLVAIELPERFGCDLAAHPLHPTVLDCATATAREPSDGAYLPFMYRSLVLHGDLPGAVTSHLRRGAAATGTIAADIDVIAADGLVVAQIEGFVMRQFDPAAILREPADGAGPAGAARAAAGLTPSSGDDGIEPDEGVRLLLDLLAARTPAQVAVRPFEGGKPVPLASPTVPPPTMAVEAAAAVIPARPAPPGQAASQVAQAGDVRSAMREIWELTLGVSDIAGDASFFDVGGSSLAAIELMTRIRDLFGIELSIAMLLDSPTIESLADELARQLGG